MNVKYLGSNPIKFTRKNKTQTLTKGDTIRLAKSKVERIGSHLFEEVDNDE